MCYNNVSKSYDERQVIRMRYTTIVGTQDQVDITIYGNVSLICRVMELGKQVGALIYEVELSGKELLEKIHLNEKYRAEIQPDHHYIITAYDW